MSTPRLKALPSRLAALGKSLGFLPLAVRHVFDMGAAGPVALYRIEAAQALGRDHRLNEAVDAWKAIAERYPGLPAGVAGYGGALRRVGRVTESLAVLEKAVPRFKHGPGLGYELAMSRLAAGRAGDALAVASEVVDRYPGHPLGYECAAQAARALLRFDEADAFLRTALDRCPGFVGLASEYAVNADMRGDRNEALVRWQRVRHLFPKASIGFAGLGAALKEVGRFDEADEVLAAGMALHPQDANVAINHAWVAEQRADWLAAMTRWNVIRDRFPDHPRVRDGWVAAEGKARLAAADGLADTAGDGTALPLPLLVEAASAADTGHAELVRQFESLGETCEFGFVQRHFGAEPLGLLRWAGTSHGQSLQALREEFRDVGSEATTLLHVNPSNFEYFTTDENYGMSMHSFIARDSAKEEVVLPRLRRRLAYLRDKLVEDLRTGEKVFVLQTGPTVPDASLIEYHAAMRRYGRNRLLCIRPVREGETPGTVQVAGNGLLFGWLDRAGYDGHYWDISFGLWLQICEAAVALAPRDEPDSPPLTA